MIISIPQTNTPSIWRCRWHIKWTQNILSENLWTQVTNGLPSLCLLHILHILPQEEAEVISPLTEFCARPGLVAWEVIYYLDFLNENNPDTSSLMAIHRRSHLGGRSLCQVRLFKWRLSEGQETGNSIQRTQAKSSIRRFPSKPSLPFISIRPALCEETIILL